MLGRLLRALSSLGIGLTIVGELLKRLGSVGNSSNLDEQPPLPGLDLSGVSLDPQTLGAEDEKPNERDTSRNG